MFSAGFFLVSIFSLCYNINDDSENYIKGGKQMKKNPVNLDPNLRDGYIPAPYVLEEGERINDFYLEPVLFHNENGPTIGVTTCGVIVKDGLYFKDMDNDGILSPYEDWRNSH